MLDTLTSAITGASAEMEILMYVGWVFVAALLALVAVALAVAFADRSARARAWERIADERRWNHDRG
jgi:hypothetical protein